MDPYSMAFAIGYYYGRAYNHGEDIDLPPHDMYHKDNKGFADGLEAGQRDFQEVDLPFIALAQSELELQK